MDKSIRLNKFLSDSGICSRRKADEHISMGKVTVNGIEAVLGQKIDPEKDKVALDGALISARSEDFVYYAVNKPKGVVSSASDEKGRETVLDLVPKEPRVYPVGRLDKESEGLIILTNDGELTNVLTHPSYKHEKEYIVVITGSKHQVAGIDQTKAEFLKGLDIDGEIMKADKVEASQIRANRYFIKMTIHTGYNRQIRRMCDKMGFEVLKLKRIRIGKLNLSDLDIEAGEYKKIKREEIIATDLHH